MTRLGFGGGGCFYFVKYIPGLEKVEGPLQLVIFGQAVLAFVVVV